MVWVRVAVALLLLMVLPATAWAQAEKRVALVIGNSAYQHTPKLTNPKNDATDVAAELKKFGFQVVDGFDLDKAAFDRKVRDFATALKAADAGVFFYAGHGLQAGGHNYLVPIDAKAASEDALDFEMLKVDVVHRAMERSTKTNILILDACRDNPLARNLARAMGARSTQIGRGLATIESGVGTLISFSTHPGAVALDGAGRNSPYTTALLKYISSATGDLGTILISVRNDVMRQTRDQQVPWEHSALRGRFYFNPAAQVADAAKGVPSRLREAAEAWGATKDTTSLQALEAFTKRYSDTQFAELARARIEELKASRRFTGHSKMIEATPDYPFDGYWVVISTHTSSCDLKGTLTTRIAVEKHIIYFADREIGRIEKGGAFRYTVPNRNHPTLTVTHSGKLASGSGRGSLTTGYCRGTLALTRE